MFLKTLSSLNSFQIIPHVSIIYLKHYYVNTLKKFTTLLLFLTLKHEKKTLITHLLVHFSLNVPKVFGNKNIYLNNDLVQEGNHGWGIQKDCLTPKSLSRRYFECSLHLPNCLLINFV